MPKISAETWGYVWTGLIVLLLLAAGTGALWVKMHPAPNPAFVPEWRCTDPEVGEVCERTKPPPAPKPLRKP